MLVNTCRCAQLMYRPRQPHQTPFCRVFKMLVKKMFKKIDG
jgi:hypothetical protein